MDLVLVPLGALPAGQLEELAPFLEAATGLSCRPGGPGPDPGPARMPERRQVDARRLLAYLQEDLAPDSRVLGDPEYHL